MGVEHDGIERNERGGVLIDQFLDFQLECFRISKNILFYRTFGRNRPIKTIDGYNGTVHRGPFRIYCIRRIADGGSG